MTARPVVEIEMFLDVSCPWCHGSIETNRRLLDELAADPEVPALQVTWRFMRLHPMPKPEGIAVEEYFSSWGDAPDAAEKARQGVREYVTSVGTRVDFTRYTYMHDPFTAHRLLAAVRDDGGDDLPSLWTLSRAVWSANFVHGVDISDDAALRGAVERAGLLLPLRIWERIADGGHADETLADHARAKEIELDGVPRMYVGGRIVPTWVDPDEVRATLRAAIMDAATAAGATTA